MAGTVLVPGTQTGWNLEAWERTFEFATYQKQNFIPTIDEAQRLYNLLHIRKDQRVTGSTISSTNDGTNLTYVNPVGTPVTLSPVASAVPIAWSENFDASTEANLDQRSTTNVEGSLAEMTETAALLNVASLTQIMSQAAIDAPMLRQAVFRLATNTNGRFVPGESDTIYGIFSTTQGPALVAIPEINSAEQRGDNENPYVRGMLSKGFGLVFMFTTCAAQDGNGWHNCVYVASAFAISWNVRSRIKRQDYELQNRLIGYNNVGSGVKNDLRALDLRTTASQL